MKTVRLGDVCEKGSSNIAQKDLENNSGQYPIYGASGLIKYVDFYKQEKEYIAIVKDGAGIGRTMLLPEKSSVIGTMQYIFPKDDIDIKFLYYAITHMGLAKYYTGAAIPHIYFKDYQNEKFNFYDLEQQKKIVEKMDSVEKVIRWNEELLKIQDDVIKSRFVEVFGNPIQNSMLWDEKPLSDCLHGIDNGRSFVCDTVSRTGSYPAILKLSAATYGFYQPQENKAMLDESDFVDKAEVHKGDLLFTRKNTPELVGMSAYVFETPENLMMPDLIFRLNTNDSINKIYLWQLINHELFRSKIQALAGGSAKSMSNISKERLLNMTIPVPPIELQLQFAEFVAQVEKAKQVIKQQLEELETLKKSLIQKYFG